MALQKSTPLIRLALALGGLTACTGPTATSSVDQINSGNAKLASQGHPIPTTTDQTDSYGPPLPNTYKGALLQMTLAGGSEPFAFYLLLKEHNISADDFVTHSGIDKKSAKAGYKQLMQFGGAIMAVAQVGTDKTPDSRIYDLMDMAKAANKNLDFMQNEGLTISYLINYPIKKFSRSDKLIVDNFLVINYIKSTGIQDAFNPISSPQDRKTLQSAIKSVLTDNITSNRDIPSWNADDALRVVSQDVTAYMGVVSKADAFTQTILQTGTANIKNPQQIIDRLRAIPAAIAGAMNKAQSDAVQFENWVGYVTPAQANVSLQFKL